MINAPAARESPFGCRGAFSGSAPRPVHFGVCRGLGSGRQRLREEDFPGTRKGREDAEAVVIVNVPIRGRAT